MRFSVDPVKGGRSGKRSRRRRAGFADSARALGCWVELRLVLFFKGDGGRGAGPLWLWEDGPQMSVVNVSRRPCTVRAFFPFLGMVLGSQVKVQVGPDRATMSSERLCGSGGDEHLGWRGKVGIGMVVVVFWWEAWWSLLRAAVCQVAETVGCLGRVGAASCVL